MIATATVLGLPVTTLATAPIVGRPATSGETAPLSGGGTTAPGTAPQQRPPSAFGPEMLFLMLGLMVFMFVMTALSGRKEKRRRAELLSSIQRHDRVQTAGGVIGTVVEVHDDEIVLKVDEATNTRIRFARSSVQTVLKKASDSRSETPQPAAAGV
jgi:preprotein translocase subunit YajC